MPTPKLDMRRFLSVDFLIPLALFFLAFALRVVGVRGWLPYVVHPDEPKLIDSAVHIVKTGDLNPNLYIWPSLYIYLQALVIHAHTVWGTLRGYYAGPQSLPDVSHVFALAPGVYMWARTFTAFVGALTVPLLYVVGRQMFNGSRRAGFAAALLLAVSPLHVEYSHFALTDVPLGLVALLVLWASYRLSHPRAEVQSMPLTLSGAKGKGPKHALDPERSEGEGSNVQSHSAFRIPHSAFVHGLPNAFWQALLCGLLVGLATGTKYNGLYLIIVPLTAWLMLSTNSKFQIPNSKLLLAAIFFGALLGFLLAEPYVLLDWPAFYRGFTFQVEAYLPANSLDQVWNAIREHLTNFSSRDAHYLLPAALGAFALLLNPPLRSRFWLLAPFPVLYLLAMSRFSLTYVRNLIVTMPFLALLGGFLIDLVATQIITVMRGSGLTLPQNRHLWNAARWAVVAIATAVVIYVPFTNSAGYALYMQRTDNRTAIWEWMKEEMRQGKRFAAELHPWQTQDYPDVLAFDVENRAAQQPLTARPPGWYRDHGYDYVILSTSYKETQRDPATWDLYRSLPEVRRLPGEEEGGKGPRITVLSTGRGADGPSAPPMMKRQETVSRFEDFAMFLGYDLAPLSSADVLVDPAEPPSPGPFKVGQAVGLNLYFQALRDGQAADPDWQVWIHLVDPRSGSTVAQVDVPPLTGQLRNYPNVQREFRPVRRWHKGEFIAGVYNFAIPANLTPGTYRLQMGMWVPPNGPGAKVDSGRGSLPSDAPVVLGEITIE